jgi:Mor family transcriptional regulator
MNSRSMSANDLPESCQAAIATIQEHFNGGLLYIPKAAKASAMGERNRKIMSMKREGVPVVTIAKTFGLSRDRVHRIIASLRDLGVR